MSCIEIERIGVERAEGIRESAVRRDEKIQIQRNLSLNPTMPPRNRYSDRDECCSRPPRPLKSQRGMRKTDIQSDDRIEVNIDRPQSFSRRPFPGIPTTRGTRRRLSRPPRETVRKERRKKSRGRRLRHGSGELDFLCPARKRSGPVPAQNGLRHLLT